MDGRQFEGLLQTLGHSRRAFVTALLAVSGGMVGSGSAEAGKNKKGKHRRRRRRTRRITLCYQGETIRVNPANKRLYHGATPGPCTCSTCETLGKTCGPIDDTCGGAVSCGVCGVGDQNSCNNGVCDTCTATCPQNCQICSSLVDGSTICAADSTAYCDLPCTTDADCPGSHRCVSGEAYRVDNSSRSWPDDCNVATPGVCAFVSPC